MMLGVSILRWEITLRFGERVSKPWHGYEVTVRGPGGLGCQPAFPLCHPLPGAMNHILTFPGAIPTSCPHAVIPWHTAGKEVRKRGEQRRKEKGGDERP